MKIYLEAGNKRYEIEASDVSVTPPVPAQGKYVMLNCINWNSAGLNAIPVSLTSECTYFVLPVSSTGLLLGQSVSAETKFVQDVHAKGKKATFSIAGGSQNVSDIHSAINNYRAQLIENIAVHLTQFGYDGVTLDIENTTLPAQTIVDFVNAVRVRLNLIKPNLIIGMYTQPYQLNTVMAKLDLCADSLTWLSAMIYDFPNTVAELKTLTLAWLPRVKNDKKKLLVGIAVNYPETGLNLTELPQVLDWVNAEGLRGVGIWDNTLLTQPYQDILKAKFPIIE